VGHNINVYNSITFLCTNDEHSEKEIKKTIPLTIATKKYLGINLTKETIDLYIEDYKTLIKEMKNGTNEHNELCL
jgi:hypothetical protein